MSSRWANMGAQMGGGVSNALGGYAKRKNMDNELAKVRGMSPEDQSLYMQLKLGGGGAGGNELGGIVAEMLRRNMGGGGARPDVGGGNAAGAGGSDPNKINVIQLSTGTPGMIPISEFDPKLYRRAQ